VKVFVTGGTGFIGGAISRALIARGDEILLLARSETKAKTLHPQCKVVKGDLTSIIECGGVTSCRGENRNTVLLY
jgi:uncharacterized protein YbjT (DUF2867 family)